MKPLFIGLFVFVAVIAEKTDQKALMIYFAVFAALLAIQ